MGTEIIMKYLAVSPIERLGLPLLLVILLRKELAVKFGVDVQQALCQISPHLCVQRVARTNGVKFACGAKPHFTPLVMG